MTARLPAVPVGECRLRLVGGTLIDGTGADPVENAEVEINNGRVSYAGPRRLNDIAGATVFDLTGTWLLPGFIDAHVHLVMNSDPVEVQRTWFPEESVAATLENMRATLDAGVTTARDLSGLTPGYRNVVARGRAAGPRLHLAISMLSPTGGHADPVLANGTLPLWAERATTPGWSVVDTTEEVVRAVRQLVRTGADVIKVCTTGGVSSPHDEPGDAGLPMEHVRAIVNEVTQRGGKPVTAHAQNDEGVRAAVLGGVSSVEHGYDMSDDTISLMHERGTVLIPTLSTLLRSPDPSRTGEAALEKRAELVRRGIDAIRRAVAAGIEVALGTDAGIHPQGRNLTELAHLVNVGLTPLNAVRAGTLNGARLLGLDSQLGSLEPGKLADIVVTDVDPMRDIAALGDPDSIKLVLQSGRVSKDLFGLAKPSPRLT